MRLKIQHVLLSVGLLISLYLFILVPFLKSEHSYGELELGIKLFNEDELEHSETIIGSSEIDHKDDHDAYMQLSINFSIFRVNDDQNKLAIVGDKYFVSILNALVKHPNCVSEYRNETLIYVANQGGLRDGNREYDRSNVISNGREIRTQTSMSSICPKFDNLKQTGRISKQAHLYVVTEAAAQSTEYCHKAGYTHESASFMTDIGFPTQTVMSAFHMYQELRTLYNVPLSDGYHVLDRNTSMSTLEHGAYSWCEPIAHDNKEILTSCSLDHVKQLHRSYNITFQGLFRDYGGGWFRNARNIKRHHHLREYIFANLCDHGYYEQYHILIGMKSAKSGTPKVSKTKYPSCRSINSKNVSYIIAASDGEDYYHPYSTLMMQSRFCLVVNGDSPWSLRLMEVVSTGCIPMIFGNGLRLPFDNIIDWTRYAVVFDEFYFDDNKDEAATAGLDMVEYFMRDLYENKIKENMQRYKGSFVNWHREIILLYSKYFQNADRISHALLKSIEALN